MKQLVIFLSLLTAFMLAGCAPVLVGAGAAGGYYAAGDSDNPGEFVSDSSITSKIKTKFLAQDGLSSFKLHVTTNNGIVELSGEVSSASMKDLAEQIARNTKGVKRVNSSITIE